MKDLLQKLLRIQTLKFVLVNPETIGLDSFIEGTKNLPVIIVISYKIETIQVIDTGIPVKKKQNE